ncbi:MAG: YncE family protein [Rikenellaceae bacterium]
MNKFLSCVMVAMLLVFVASCRKELPIVGSTSTQVSDGQDGEIKGLFLLNEANMGSNKSTLDYYDYTSGVYSKNIFPERNPSVARELGDTGNDIKIWGGKLYAVLNGSNLVEVMNVTTAEHVAVVSIPNCRYLAFKDNYAYVTSFAGAINDDDANRRLGYVAKIDTATMAVVAECTVGYQPEEMAVVGDKLYVANSGGYISPEYDSTLSVIDLDSFSVVDEIEVAVNLHRVRADDDGKLWVSSRGDYEDVASALYVIDTENGEVVNQLNNLAVSNMTISATSLYVCSTEWSNAQQSNTVSYAVVDTEKQVVVNRGFITDGTDANITTPYGLAVNPYNGEIFVTDATDFITPGKLYCYSSVGVLRWSVTTGDAPAHIVFTNRELQSLE